MNASMRRKSCQASAGLSCSCRGMLGYRPANSARKLVIVTAGALTPAVPAAVRRQGNLLLCTLLLGNTVINSAISILLADLTTGAIGLVVATFSILIFGELSLILLTWCCCDRLPVTVTVQHCLGPVMHATFLTAIKGHKLSQVVSWPGIV